MMDPKCIFFKVTFLISVVVVLRLTVWIQPEEKKTHRFNAGVAVFIYWLRHSSEVKCGHRATRGFRFWSFVHIFSHCSLLQSWIRVFAACMTSLWHLGECLSPSSANCWLFFFLSPSCDCALLLPHNTPTVFCPVFLIHLTFCFSFLSFP